MFPIKLRELNVRRSQKASLRGNPEGEARCMRGRFGHVLSIGAAVAMVTGCETGYSLPPGTVLNTAEAPKLATSGGPSIGYGVEWLVSRNRRNQCGDASHAKDIIRDMSAATSTSEGDETQARCLAEIAESQPTSNPPALWGRWAVELYKFNKRCQAGIDEHALDVLVERKHAFLEEALLSSAIRESDCDAIVAVERMEAWPFPFDLAEQLIAGKFHNAEVTRQLWIQTLSQSISSCAQALTDRDKTSIRVHQDRLERLIKLDDELLIDLRKRLSVAIAAGHADEASELAAAISEREAALDTREADAQLRAARLREAKANAKQAAVMRAEAQKRLSITTEKSDQEKDKSNSWVSDILSGIGEGVGRAAACRIQGSCGHY